jgi:hypothetical protein
MVPTDAAGAAAGTGTVKAAPLGIDPAALAGDAGAVTARSNTLPPLLGARDATLFDK